MKWDKSGRHSYYIGLLGEVLLCDYLSRVGFEVMRVDHVGFDVLAERADTGFIAVSVKARTRDEAKTADSVSVIDEDEVSKIRALAGRFGAIPWIAVYVEHQAGADLFATSLAHFLQRYSHEDLKTHTWKMTARAIEEYKVDEEVFFVTLKLVNSRWWSTNEDPAPLGQ